MSRWRPPQALSRRGAGHRRRGQPCQDASLTVKLSGSGEECWLMAVADGHGNSRHPRSAAGSAAACGAARTAVAAALLRHGADDADAWQRLLAEDLPRQIQQLWLEEVSRHWQRSGSALPCDPVAYGTTLGLVLMAPRWWGWTGLGDWDLLRVDTGGKARLISEESGEGERGEATASLCLPLAAAHCSRRAGLERLGADAPGFALVLATDGIRKSCASDADHRRLAVHLAGAAQDPALADLLDRISAEGCGDDVSVAIGCWGAGVPEPAAPPPLPPPAGATTGRPPLPWLAPLLGAALLAAGLGSATLRPHPPVSTDGAAAPGSLRAEVRRLCGNPGLIEPELRGRRSQFERLRQGILSSETLLNQASLDPLGALIAWSQGPAARGTAALQNAGTTLAACAELVNALERLWRSPGPGSPPAALPSSR